MANATLINKPPQSAVDSMGGSVTPGYASFFSAVWYLLNGSTQSGATTNRPGTVNANNDFLWIGMPYLDTTLGKPIWLKSVKPNVWIDATGGTV